MDTDADAIARGEHSDPFAYLGPHQLNNDHYVIRTFQPGAERVEVMDLSGRETLAGASCTDESDLFQIKLAAPPPRPYALRVVRTTMITEIVDPYQFGPWLGATDLYLIREGTHESLFERLGAHLSSLGNVDGVAFAVWAPNASRVSVVADFNHWDRRCHPMRSHPGAGIWELFVPGVTEGERYKFDIGIADVFGQTLKADPVAFEAERPPATASIVTRIDRHRWSDEKWMEQRRRRDLYSGPMSIYEVHLGSWRRKPEEGNRYLTYAELTATLVPYVKGMGFTHVELLPVTEYPFDGSWGYQPTSLYAPTSRFGTPTDFQIFVDACHQAEIGVIFDWVPGHFPNDPHGLARFDGTCLYEHADPRQGFHRDWNTLIYNFGRAEVAEFLWNSALFWLGEYHLDGLRVDAVASMLYLDYSRKPGDWIPNRHGGNENLEAVAFLRHLNEKCYERFPGTMTIAEESTAWPRVSRPTFDNGLGFGFKWNMGWMHDTLAYMAEDPVNRAFHHDRITFGLLYAFTESFILPLSHDEVVHGKRSILGRMPGDRWQRFANLRAYYGFMYGHPGKKLLFMGNEFAQENEWNHDRSLDWHLLGDHFHQGVLSLVRDLNSLHRDRSALHELDHDGAGFEWIDASDRDASVIAFQRRGRAPGDHLVVIVNFTPVPREGYRIGMPGRGSYVEIFNSDNVRYGGSGVENRGALLVESVHMHGREQSLALTLPPLAAIYLAPTR